MSRTFPYSTVITVPANLTTLTDRIKVRIPNNKKWTFDEAKINITPGCGGFVKARITDGNGNPVFPAKFDAADIVSIEDDVETGVVSGDDFTIESPVGKVFRAGQKFAIQCSNSDSVAHDVIVVIRVFEEEV